VESLYLLKLRRLVDGIVGELPERSGKLLLPLTLVFVEGNVVVVGQKDRHAGGPIGMASVRRLDGKVLSAAGLIAGHLQLLLANAVGDCRRRERGRNVIQQNRHPSAILAGG